MARDGEAIDPLRQEIGSEVDQQGDGRRKLKGMERELWKHIFRDGISEGNTGETKSNIFFRKSHESINT